MVPLLIGLAAGRLEDGVFAALGAFSAGIVSFQGVTRSRATAVVAASVGMAVSTFLGAVVAAAGIAQVLPIVLWAYLAGLSSALGMRWSVVVVNWTVALLIGLSLSLPPGPAAERAALVLAGGLLQGLLVVLSWAFRPGEEERQALAATYSALAGQASAMGEGRGEPPSPAAFPAAEPLGDPNPLLPTTVRQAYLDLLAQADRIRASLAGICAYLPDRGETDRIRRFCEEVGACLDEVARGLGGTRRARASRLAHAERTVSELEVALDAPWRWAGEALLCQLRTVTRILLRGAGTPEVMPGGDRAGQVSSASGGVLGSSLGLLGASASLRTETGQHALRLAVAMGVAELVGEAGRFQYGRWAVLTALLVLKPDYGSTVARAVQRMVGTLIGAVLAVGFVWLVQPSPLEAILAAAAVVALASAFFQTNYTAYSLFLTAFVVLLLELLGLRPVTTAEGRLGATITGGVWALALYVVWPSWEGLSAPGKFAVLLERLGTYLATLLTSLAYPERLDLPRLRREEGDARRARSEVEAAVERLSREPRRPPLTPELAASLMARFARLARALLAAETLVERRRKTSIPGATAAQLDALGNACRSTMQQLASSLRTGSAPGTLAPLRRLQDELSRQTQDDRAALVVSDALVDAVESVVALLDEAPRAEASRPRA
jgi:uncharacterized membrane protein YccC